MSTPDAFVRFWRALDGLFSDVSPAWWGAVVTDGRFPRIWDANYARVDEPATDLGAHEVLAALEPAARAAGAELLHVVSLRPESTTRLLSELSTAGHRLTWDLLMRIDAPPRLDDDVLVEPLADSPELWGAVGDSLALFGVEPGEAVDQLRSIERTVLAPGGKRWFGVRGDDGTLVSLGALHLLDGVGYVDNVATVPAARGRGFAGAITVRLVREAREAGAAPTFLLADPDDEPVVRLYRRLGFLPVGRLASTKGPLSHP